MLLVLIGLVELHLFQDELVVLNHESVEPKVEHLDGLHVGLAKIVGTFIFQLYLFVLVLAEELDLDVPTDRLEVLQENLHKRVILGGTLQLN